MAVSKNKRKNENKKNAAARQRKAHLARQAKKQLSEEKKKAELMALLQEGENEIKELVNESNTLYDSLDGVIKEYKEAEFLEEVPEEVRVKHDTNITVIEGLISEGRKQLETCENTHQELLTKFENNELDPVDLNMGFIDNFFKLNEHIRHIETKVGDIAEACVSKNVDPTTINNLTN